MMKTTLGNGLMLMPTGSLESYIQQAGDVPVLTAEEEHDLAVKLQQDNDLTAARTLVLSHLRFVIYIAKGYNGYGLPVADLVQEGNVGLMKAVKRFDPDQGVRLVSYAVHWIRAEIHEYILKNWRIVKVATTKAQRKLFFNLRSSKKRLGWFTMDEVETVANKLGVSTDTVLEMEKRMSSPDMSFDLPVDADDEESTYAPAAYLQNNEGDPAKQLEQSNWDDHHNDRLHTALGQLDDRAKDILSSRWLAEKKATLQDLANKYQVSAERIRQLEKSAMKKLQGSLAA